jgi:hypothetical protein
MGGTYGQFLRPVDAVIHLPPVAGSENRNRQQHKQYQKQFLHSFYRFLL